MHSDKYFMKKTLKLAQSGAGYTNPNPMVGAVLVREGKIISEGYHQYYGGSHAEIHAIEQAGRQAAGSTLYVNLEPCSHHGKTPPCCEAVVHAGISRVVCAMEDPNPLVSGQGIAFLRQNGVEVQTGVLRDEAMLLNEIFIKYIRTHHPFVILKSAMSLDGKIATRTGESKWITGEQVRQYSHQIRHQVSAIMVGVQTVIADNPVLTTRLQPDTGKNPARIIMDSHGRTPVSSNLIKTIFQGPVIIISSPDIPEKKTKTLKAMGAEIITVTETDRAAVLRELMPVLGERGIDSLLIEGGGTLADSAVRAGIVDKYLYFIAPLIIGGREALTPVEGEGVDEISRAVKLQKMSTRTMGRDILVEAYPFQEEVLDVYRDN
ncbi:MAG: bifunctional diaminohydroxyphosphoribosylaminopyrimidine deaminase/5-amino-6-(5-phosphoribosylamino)uracil reductase RibD [Spirochaetales bacterium]|nr:bifunctional diaminohydroxyphosphoribosylaminopyrimidine deaminase/5-amino-6-(5-phosphoribosylamino)uracil reductase RibD [Spirochaetales bacterium]